MSVQKDLHSLDFYLLPVLPHRADPNIPRNWLLSFFCFFSPIPCTFTSSSLDGMARIFIYVDMQEHTILSCLDPFLSYHLIPDRKTIWTTLGSNPARQLCKQARYPLCHRLLCQLVTLLMKLISKYFYFLLSSLVFDEIVR